MEREWIVSPLTGVGPLRFGMSLGDVQNLEPLLGAIYAEIEERNSNGIPVLQQARDMEAPILYFTEGRLTGIQIDLHSRFDIRFGVTSIFGDLERNVLSALETSNGGALFGLGAVLFSNLSISTIGFFAGFDENGLPIFWEQLPDRPSKVINLEMRDAYKPYLENYQPISFEE